MKYEAEINTIALWKVEWDKIRTGNAKKHVSKTALSFCSLRCRLKSAYIFPTENHF